MPDTFELLVVDDDEGDLLLVEETLGDMDLNIHTAEDGHAALEFLRSSDNPRPHLVLLDINMPRLNGLETLKAIKSDEDLKRIPVCMLTTSHDDMDVMSAYENFANSYVTKPVELDNFANVLKDLAHFWGTSVQLPVSP